MFDDVIEVGETIFDSLSHGKPAVALEKGFGFVKKQVQEAIPKQIAKDAGQKFLPVELIAKGADFVITKTGLDPGHEFRDRIGFTRKGKVPSAFEGEVLDDDVLLQEAAPGEQQPDRLIGNTIDP